MKGIPLFETVVSPKAAKRLRKFPRDSQKNIADALKELNESPFLGYALEKPFTNYRSLKVKANRVEYRIIHQINVQRQEIWVLLIEPREEVYKKLRQLLA